MAMSCGDNIHAIVRNGTSFTPNLNFGETLINPHYMFRAHFIDATFLSLLFIDFYYYGIIRIFHA